MPTPEEVAKYCPERADKYKYWLQELEEHPEREWMSTSWMESTHMIVEARKERDVFKQALEEIKEKSFHDGETDSYPISMRTQGGLVIKLEEYINKALASINKDSSPVT